MTSRSAAVVAIVLGALVLSSPAAQAAGRGLDGLEAPPSGGGIPSGFVALFVLFGLAALATTAWRISTARDLARKAGLDPNQATAVTLLGNDGLDATYLASSLRQSPAAPARSTQDRLAELQHLLNQGLVTDEEYASRRAQILDSV